MSDPPARSRDELFDDDDADEPEHRRLFERAVPEVIKRIIERALESGVEKLTEGPENLRHMLHDLKLPKEAMQYLYGQVDDTKKGLYRVVAKEIRDVLDHTNFAEEIAKVLTLLSFEINTQIRFVPNPVADEEEAERDHAGKARGDEAAEGERSKAAGGGSGDSSIAPEGGLPRIPRPKVVSKVVMKARDKLERRGKD